MNIIDHQMNIQEAIDAPRIHCLTGEIFMESRIPKDVQQALTSKGHQLSVTKDFDLYFGGVQGVFIDPRTGTLYGGADSRRDGFAAGY